MPGEEIALGAVAGEAVPRTDGHAVIAAIDAVPQHGSEFNRNCAFEFNRQIGDAAPGIHHIGGDNRLCGTNVDAGDAIAAVRLRWFIDGQGKIGVDLSQKKPGSGMLIDEIAVLANPSQSRFCANGFSSTGAESTNTR